MTGSHALTWSNKSNVPLPTPPGLDNCQRCETTRKALSYFICFLLRRLRHCFHYSSKYITLPTNEYCRFPHSFILGLQEIELFSSPSYRNPPITVPSCSACTFRMLSWFRYAELRARSNPDWTYYLQSCDFDTLLGSCRSSTQIKHLSRRGWSTLS